MPTPVGETGVQWRNAAYAVQWWVFALFALWMWGRMVRDETRRARAEAADDEDRLRGTWRAEGRMTTAGSSGRGPAAGHRG